MAGTVIADNLQAAATSTLVIKNGVANTPPTIQDSAGTQIGTFCRAWVNFDGTGTVAIRASFNVSSITDNGTGDYTVNFTNALSDDNYAVAFAIATNVGATNAKIRSATNDGDATLKSTTQLRLIVSGASSLFDNTQVCVSIFR